MPDRALESALRSGADAKRLEEYFGAQLYDELRSLAAEASAREVRGGQRVLILPGIMGSKLGVKDAFLGIDDVYWFDFFDTASGKLVKLALNGKTGKPIVALGVFALFYLKLKLRLRAAGYDADYWPFDWRKDISRSGADLAQAVAGAARPVDLVCHSMGGLVARAAVKQLENQDKIGRIVMLGTPNYGSFAPVRAIRASHEMVVKVARLDAWHDAKDLSQKVFRTFPGLYQMLPSPQKFRPAGFDIFSAESWPQSPPRPLPSLLDVGKRIGEHLADGDDRFTLIAGVNFDTDVDARLDENGAAEFQFSSSKEGDGTVPLAFAQLPGVPTYFIEEEHGSLPNNRRVALATADILASGCTDRLPTQWAPSQRGRLRTFREAELRRDPFDGRERRELRGAELRHVLDGFLSPEARDAETDRAAPAPIIPSAAAPAASTDRIVVGRRRQRRLEIRLARGSIAEADARALVLGIFLGVTPSGAARSLDARMRGAISDLTARRMFAGNVGEVFILPVGRNYLRADFVVLAGLGPFDRFTGEVQTLVAENVVRTMIRTDIEEFALVLPGGNAGAAPSESLEHLTTGFLRGLIDADLDHRFRRITLCEIDSDRHAALRQKLHALATTKLFDEVELTIDETELPAALDLPEVSRSLRRGADPCYLLVRQEMDAANLRASVLGADGKAAIMSSLHKVDEKALEDHLRGIELDSFNAKALSRFGQELAKLVLSEDIARALAHQRNRHLVIVHDRPTSRIPWETISLGDWFPAGEKGLSRRYMADNLSVAKWLEERQLDDSLDVLAVINPTNDLTGAEKEGARLLSLLESIPRVRVDALRGNQAGRQELLARFRSGKYDVVHYAGHAEFNALQPAQSGIRCAGDQLLTGADLAGVGNLPILMFFNACESGRLRGTSSAKKLDSKKPKAPKTIRDRITENVGLAEAFLRGGVANYIGTYWPVGDDSAKAFAGAFYPALLAGRTIGEALNEGRAVVKGLKTEGAVDWCDYVFYGDHEFVIKTPS
jgi:pimeloyl-ACP methyl ester carboxylesterase